MSKDAVAPAPAACVRGYGRPLLMGVLNVTPDSFYHGSRSQSAEEAVERGLALAAEGADILDVGGQSTRPGSDPVPVSEERRRVIPALRELAKRTKAKLSVDTDKAEIALEALDAGATILNDVTGLRAPGLLEAATRFERVVIMHMLGDSPKTMQAEPRYADCLGEVSEFLRERLEAFAAAGGKRERAWIDPGIGFGKTAQHNLELLRGLRSLGKIAPVLVGASRKSFLAKLSPDSGPEDRLPGSLAVAAWAAQQDAAVLRVHDVAATRRAVDVAVALWSQP